MNSEAWVALGHVEENVRDYVREEGPLAYANVYQGRFLKDSSGIGVGIAEMLRHLKNGRTCAGITYEFLTPEQAEEELHRQEQNIHQMPQSIVHLLLNKERRQEVVVEWCRCYKKMVEAKIVQVRRNYFFGENRRLDDLIVRPLALLSEELRTFGHILNEISDIYISQGVAFENYASTQALMSIDAEINIAALDARAYAWLKREADNRLRSINMNAFRDAVVDSFFDNHDDWMRFSEDCVNRYNGSFHLKNEERPVPARYLFDRVVNEVVGDISCASLRELMTAMAQTNSTTGLLNSTATMLYQRSQILLDASIPSKNTRQYVMYPSEWDRIHENGRSLGANLRYAFERINPAVLVVKGNSDRLEMYQLAGPFEIYHLRTLPDWERAYEAKMQSGVGAMHLHGYAPLIKAGKDDNGNPVYEEQLSWKDFPAITPYTDDITKPDPVTGAISHEGQLRLELRELMQKAKKLGVLYADCDEQRNFCVYCISRLELYGIPLDLSGVELSDMKHDEMGQILMGRDLMEYIANHNRMHIQDASKRVSLRKGGVMSEPVPSEELAWRYAEKILRKHPPMYLAIKDTVASFEALGREIEAYNEKALARYNPAKMLVMIHAGVLYEKCPNT